MEELCPERAEYDNFKFGWLRYMLLYQRHFKETESLASKKAFDNLYKKFGQKFEEAKKLYPLEFADKITIYFKKEHPDAILKDAFERKERCFMLKSARSLSENRNKIEILEVIGFKDLEDRLSKIPRDSGFVYVGSAKEWFDTGNSDLIYILGHTHPPKSYGTPRIGPSRTDICNITLGKPNFVAEIVRKFFYITPYRLDSLEGFPDRSYEGRLSSPFQIFIDGKKYDEKEGLRIDAFKKLKF